MRSALIVALLTGCALLTACGQKGPLYIPGDEPQPPAPAPQSQPQRPTGVPMSPSV